MVYEFIKQHITRIKKYMQQNKNKISIAMTTFNGAKYIKEQIDSFIWQNTIPNEVIIVDDASNDNTVDILKHIKKTAPFEIKIIENHKNIGSKTKYGFAQNFAKAISHCTGNIIFLSDQDDVWFKEKISKHLEIYNTHKEILLIANNSIRTYEDLQHHNLTQLDYASITLGLPQIHTGCCFSFKSELIKYILPIPNNCSHDMWIERIINNSNLRYDLYEPLQYFRRLATSWSTQNQYSNCVTLFECYTTKLKRALHSIIYNARTPYNWDSIIDEQNQLISVLNTMLNDFLKQKKPIGELSNVLKIENQRLDLYKQRVKTSQLKNKTYKLKQLLCLYKKYRKLLSLKDIIKDMIN